MIRKLLEKIIGNPVLQENCFYTIFASLFYLLIHLSLVSATNPEENSQTRIVMHVDMDSFYASVEVREHPELKGKPVCVVMKYNPELRRGAVSTCSYEARKFGVHSAMSVAKASKLCPDCVFLPVRMDIYKEVSGRVMSILKGYAEQFEQVSVDEAYLVPFNVHNFDDAAGCALRIKDEIKKNEGITCSVGIGSNKLIAKIASGYQKPDGLTVVKPEGVQDFLYSMPVSKIPGVGKKTTEILKVMGITKVEELANVDVQLLTERFGKMGLLMKQRANGIDLEEVEEREGAKSISKHITFDEDTDDPEKIESTLNMLADVVYDNLKKNHYLFRTVNVLVRLNNFSTYTRSKTIQTWTQDIEIIKSLAKELINEFHNKKLRLVGVGVSNLKKKDELQTLITSFK